MHYKVVNSPIDITCPNSRYIVESKTTIIVSPDK